MRASKHAYNRDGCTVCSECRDQFSREPAACPLYILSLAARPPSQRPHFVTRHGFLVQWGAGLADALKRRGYPEETEVFWMRLFGWLRREWGAFRWGRNG